jgi:ribosomal protein L24
VRADGGREQQGPAALCSSITSPRIGAPNQGEVTSTMGRLSSPGVVRTAWYGAVATLAVIALGASASTALASNANIVRKGAPPAKFPPNTHYFTTIQAAVNASKAGDYVLIEPGVYDEAVKVTSAQSGIWIRGMNRNKVIVDGQNKPGNGIEIEKANDVWVENLTVRNFDTGAGCPVESCGNEIWWNGGPDGKIGAHGWFGAYLTTYDTGLNGGYGIFTGNETEGSWEHIYASGFNDSGMYIGACQECDARVTDATMENNSLGYSGSNSGGELAIEDSLFRNNSSGVLPNSENPGDAPPPQDGECGRENIEHPNPTPTISTTNIKRCTVIRDNVITENNNSTVPVNESTARASFGNGIILPGVYADLVEKNKITNNEKTGVFGIEYPNPFTPGEFEKNGTIFFQLAGNKISKNKFSNNGYHGGPFTGDVTLASGANEIFLGTESQSKNNCLSGNKFKDATFPAEIEGTWGCQNETTPNPGGAPAVYEYILAAAEEAAAVRKPTPQPAPPAQKTMPNPCTGAPRNPLCP